MNNEPKNAADLILHTDKVEQIEEAQNCATLYHAPEIDNLVYNVSASAATREFELAQITLFDELGGDQNRPATVEYESGAVSIADFCDLANGMRESAKKLLDYLSAQMTKQNSKNQSGEPNLIAQIDLREYAELCGRDVSTETRLKAFRKVFNNDMDTLYKMSVSFKDKRGKTVEMRICQARGLDKGKGKSGLYYFMFAAPFAKHLINRNLLLKLPLSLYAAGSGTNNSSLAYSLGRYLCDHYNLDSNRKTGRYNIISIKSILAKFSTYFPDREAAERGRHNNRIISTVERALEELEDKGVIQWEYCGAKKTQAEPPTTYHEFEQLYIKYTVIDAPDDSERIKRNDERKKQARIRKAKAISRNKATAQSKNEGNSKDE